MKFLKHYERDRKGYPYDDVKGEGGRRGRRMGEGKRAQGNEGVKEKNHFIDDVQLVHLSSSM